MAKLSCEKCKSTNTKGKGFFGPSGRIAMHASWGSVTLALVVAFIGKAAEERLGGGAGAKAFILSMLVIFILTIVFLIAVVAMKLISKRMGPHGWECLDCGHFTNEGMMQIRRAYPKYLKTHPHLEGMKCVRCGSKYIEERGKRLVCLKCNTSQTAD